MRWHYRSNRYSPLEIGNTLSRFDAYDEHKIDRYGKKYSWIAYFEMWGEREATRTLPDFRLEERTPDCGPDPSFPRRPPDWTPPIPDLFSDRGIGTEAWVEGGFTPEWKPLLVVPEINGHQGEWVLVQGFVRGVDEGLYRELFAYLRGVFVARRDMHRLRTLFLAIDCPGNSEIPEGATEAYLFAGEAGRRNNYARHLFQRNGRYRRQVREVSGRYVIPSLPAGEQRSEPLLEPRGPSQTMRYIPGVRIELPSIHFGWESYHSTYNDFSEFDLPAPSLMQRLGLASKNREIDFYDQAGRPGTLYRVTREGQKGQEHKLLYFRADLLRRYLAETRQVLVWCNRGERDWLKKMEGHAMIENSARQRIYQAHRHIHRSFSHWP